MSDRVAASPSDNQLHVFVEPSLRFCMSAAATRLGYAYPSLRFVVDVDGIAVTGLINDESLLQREVLHAVYREHILYQALPLRHSLIDGLLRS